MKPLWFFRGLSALASVVDGLQPLHWNREDDSLHVAYSRECVLEVARKAHGPWLLVASLEEECRSLGFLFVVMEGSEARGLQFYGPDLPDRHRFATKLMLDLKGEVHHGA